MIALSNLTVPDGAIVGILDEGAEPFPVPAGATVLNPGDAIPLATGNYILNHTLSRTDAVSKARAVAALVRLARAGSAIALVSHDEPLLESCADEIWWFRSGRLISRGYPSEILAAYRRHVAEALRASGDGQSQPLAPVLRRGDGRASLERIELIGENGLPTNVFRSGEEALVRVTVRFAATVENPVVGILLRTRIGLNVYGTNTELEHLNLGPVAAGEAVRVDYRFRCDLCPGEYTLTAASHDPDGLWHDWMEDAVAFSVSDSRYTAGFANLRANVQFARF